MNSVDPVAIDLVTVDSAVTESAEARRDLASVEQELVPLRTAVCSACGDRSPVGDGVARLTALLTQQAANERFVGETMAAAAAVDRPVPVIGLHPSSGPPGLSEPLLAGFGPVLLGSSPWLDPDSDSWVVNLHRIGLGLAPSPAFRRRVVTEGPAAIAVLAGALTELSTPNQIRLAVTEPEVFAANWGRVGRGALGTVASYLEFAPLAMTASVPGLDPLLAAATGRSPGQDLARSVIDLAAGWITDPDAVGESMLGWDQLEDDPYRWAGAFAPDVAIDLLTAGAGRWLGAGRTVTRGRRAVTTVAPSPGRFGVDDLAGSFGPRRGDRRRALEVQRRREPEWADAGPVRSHRERPFEPPDGWVADVNGGGIDAPGRRTNCVDCARAVESNWRGDDAVAAPLASDRVDGTSLDRLEDWSGGRLVPTSLDEVEHRLQELGPGSSAMVASTWDSGGAHAYNAINDRGTIVWVDGQLGEVGRWPPRYAHSVDRTLALFIGPDGRPR